MLAFAAEKSIRRSDLPLAVEKALQQQVKGATIKGFATETENGHLVYEAELIVDGHTKDVQFDANGTLQEIEEEVSFDTLSPQVKAALTAKAKGGTVRKVESLRKKDKLVAYEAQIDKGGRHREIQVGPNGETLHHESSKRDVAKDWLLSSAMTSPTAQSATLGTTVDVCHADVRLQPEVPPLALPGLVHRRIALTARVLG